MEQARAAHGVATLGQVSQYTKQRIERLLAENGTICSMSRAGNVWDDSAMESFFSSQMT